MQTVDQINYVEINQAVTFAPVNQAIVSVKMAVVKILMNVNHSKIQYVLSMPIVSTPLARTDVNVKQDSVKIVKKTKYVLILMNALKLMGYVNKNVSTTGVIIVVHVIQDINYRTTTEHVKIWMNVKYIKHIICVVEFAIIYLAHIDVRVLQAIV